MICFHCGKPVRNIIRGGWTHEDSHNFGCDGEIETFSKGPKALPVADELVRQVMKAQQKETRDGLRDVL